MQLPGRVTASIEVLVEMEKSHRPVALVLKDWGNSHRFAGSGDRAAIGNLVYDALRRRLSHAYIMDDSSPRALILSVLVRDWGEDREALAAAFETDKFAPKPLSAAETTKLGAPSNLNAAPEHVQADIPEWLAQSFREAFKQKWVEEGAALSARPSLDMRVNTLKSDRDRVLKSLSRFDAKPTRYAQHGVRIEAGTRNARTPNVQADEAYRKGWFEVQDEGSQLVAEFADAQPGMQVLDYCAGAGGKSLALAATMQNKGQIFAHDADRVRLAPIYDRIKRAGARNIQVRPPEPEELERLENKMDLVLVDAPCTGTGTWRRRPDTKWRLKPDQLTERTNQQGAILDRAATYVRPGGRLTYVTCSVLPQENSAQIQRFLAAQTEFSILQSDQPTQLLKEHGTEDGGFLLSPLRTNTDGFFVANLVRNG